MHFKTHSYLDGKHAFLSPSKYHWLGYDEDKLDRVFYTAEAAKRGDELHAFASNAIRLGVRLPKSPTTLNLYVNDAIGYKMVPEQMLFFSENCFGKADAISFRNNKLRIHDLKTGITPSSEHQLEIYAALFCLEYKQKPLDISFELRIYQNDEVRIFETDPDVIIHVIDKIRAFDRRLSSLKEGLM